jgi:hypothetical protein
MNKIQECVIWFGEVDSKTLVLFVIIIIIIIIILIQFIILHDKIPKFGTRLR